MIWLLILAVVASATTQTWVTSAITQTCVHGAAGTNGQNIGVTVTSANGCYTQTVTGVSTPIIRCNGTDGAPGVSTTIQPGTGVNAGCAFFIGAAGLSASGLVCNGTAGTQGSTGAQGPVGPMGTSVWPTLTTAGTASGCVSVVANGSVSICNGTVGLTGIQGIQGPTGGPGNPGFTGPTGTAGAAGSVIPSYFVVDGVSKISGSVVPYTFVGIAQALCYVGCGSTDCSTCGASSTGTGGTVYIGANCGIASTPCTQGPQTISAASGTDILNIPSGVTLDMGGNILGFWTGGCGANIGPSYTSIYAGFWNNVVRGTQAATSPAAILSIQQASEGSTLINVTANSYVTTGLALGQMCTISGLLSQEGLSTLSLQTKLIAFNNATGSMTFRDPLPGVCPVGCTVTCSTLASIVRNAGLRNGQILAQGSCSSGAIDQVVVTGVDGFQMADVVFTGSFGSASAGTKFLDTNNMLDSNFERITFRDLQTSGGAATAIWRFAFNSGCDMKDFRITNTPATEGIFFGAAAYNTISGLWVDSSVSQAMAITQASYNYFSNVEFLRDDTGGTNGVMQTDTRSRHNIFFDLSIVGVVSTAGGGGAAIYLSNTGDSYNQFYGLVIRNEPYGKSILLSGGAVGNFFEGDIDMPVSLPGSTDPMFGNAFRSFVGPNGHAYTSIRNATIAASDFPANRMYGFYAATDLFMGAALIGSDAVVRRQTVAVA